MSYSSLLETMQGHSYVGYFTCLCPFHPDHEPSFFVYENSSNPYYEFQCRSASCGKHGTLKYLENFLGVSSYSPQSPKKVVLPQFRKWEEQFGDVETIALHAHKFLLAHPQFASYLKGRKMDMFIRQGMFGYMSGWLLLPVRNEQGHIVDIVCRAINSKNNVRYVLMKNDKTKDAPLYSPDWKRVQESNVIYIPFGMMDSWAIYALGFPSITGTTGKSINPDQIKALGKDCYKIIPDKGEEEAAYHLAGNLGWRGDVMRINFPYQTKDPDEIRRKFGNKKLLSLLEA